LRDAALVAACVWREIMAQPVIAVTDSPFPSLDPAKKALARLAPEFRMAKSAAADDILAVARDADAILVTYAKLPGELLRQLTRCKAIGRFGLGVDNIDLPAAKELGIAVNYVPDYCLREVSDHAMALLLALARKVTFSNRLVQSGRWEVPPIVPLRRLEGQVLGLVGFGNIPRVLAPKAKAFGLRVLTHDPYVKPDALAAAGVEGVSFDDLLAGLHFCARAADAGDAWPDECRGLRQDEEGRLPDQHGTRAAGR
jgi:D-3-phosphoglycerate dehydrogenase